MFFTEETQSLDDDGLLMITPRNLPVMSNMTYTPNEWLSPRPGTNRRNRSLPKNNILQQPSSMMNWNWNEQMHQTANPQMVHLAPVSTIAPELFEKRLSSLTVEGVGKLLYKIEDINDLMLPEYCNLIKEHNITGKVLLHCDLDELKKLLKMSFGDWEMFKVMLISLREYEVSSVYRRDEKTNLKMPKNERKSMNYWFI